jgi:glycosyltransferase involved in cell wall biosynthesis
MRTSLIITTYNRPDFLKLTIESYAAQSLLPSELVIADDGSREETRMLIREMQDKYKNRFPISHVWHEDIGYRRSAILNKAVRECNGEYLIFTDQDCLAHEDMVRAHVEQSAPSAILGGKRVDLGKEFTERLLKNNEVITSVTPALILDSIRHRSRKVEEGIIISSPFLRRILHRERITNDGIWGCNCSLYKSLFMEVNGYDEDFKYAVEDNDLGIRVLNQGGTIISVRGLAVMFHLWHQRIWNLSDKRYDEDKMILKRRVENKEKVCKNGVIKRTQ